MRTFFGFFTESLWMWRQNRDKIYLLRDCTIEPILLKRGAEFFIDLPGFQEVDGTMHVILANFPDDSFV